MSRHLYKIIFVFFILGRSFFYSNQVYAQEGTGFSLIVEPAYQEVEIPKDATSVETSILFKNTSDVAQQVEVFAYDFKQTDHFGSIALLDGFTGEYLHTLASFLSFEKDSLIIGPHAEEKLNIKIFNRQTLSPGGHYAAVVARAVDDQQYSQQKILPAVSALLLVRKTDGERIHLSLKEIDWHPSALAVKIPAKINLRFENSGNVHVIPRGTVRIKNLFGKVIFQGTINESSLYLLPGTMRIIPVKLQQSRQVFPISFLTVEINGRSDVGQAVFSNELSFVYLDLRLTLVLLVLVAWQIKRFIRKKKSEKKQPL